MEICENSALPIPMVPRLHQSNGYIKSKLRAWRVQNCIALVGADTVLLRGRKVPRFMGGSMGPRMEICEILGLLIPMVPLLHQSNGYIKKKLRAWRVQKCIDLVGADTVLFTAWPQSTPFHWGWYRALNGNMRNFGPTNSHGAAFVPKQWLYQKEATGMDSSKLYRPCWCRYRTYLCEEAKYPVSWG